jgi:hypothetical protein
MSRHSVYHSLVAAFQAEVIRRALAATGGNRTHAARLLGLQRTYLLRLMRDRGIDVPQTQRKGRPCRVGAPTVTALPEFRIEINGWDPLAPPKDGDRLSDIAPLACPRAAEAVGVARSARSAARRHR